MRIIVAHNFYQQPGGEDNCVAAEIALLQSNGHQVTEYFQHNDDIDHTQKLTPRRKPSGTIRAIARSAPYSARSGPTSSTSTTHFP